MSDQAQAVLRYIDVVAEGSKPCIVDLAAPGASNAEQQAMYSRLTYLRALMEETSREYEALRRFYEFSQRHQSFGQDD